MKNLFIVFFCLVSVLAIKANGQESLWKIQAVDYQGTYYGAAVANGGIGILPWKEPFSVRHVMLNHVFDAAAPQDVSRVLRGISSTQEEKGRPSISERMISQPRMLFPL